MTFIIIFHFQDEISDFSDDDEPVKSTAELLSQQFGSECGYGEEEDYYWELRESDITTNLVISVHNQNNEYFLYSFLFPSLLFLLYVKC